MGLEWKPKILAVEQTIATRRKGTTCEEKSCGRGYHTFEKSSLLESRLHTSASKAGSGSKKFVLIERACILKLGQLRSTATSRQTRIGCVRESIYRLSSPTASFSISPCKLNAIREGGFCVTSVTESGFKLHSNGERSSSEHIFCIGPHVGSARMASSKRWARRLQIPTRIFEGQSRLNSRPEDSRAQNSKRHATSRIGLLLATLCNCSRFKTASVQTLAFSALG